MRIEKIFLTIDDAPSMNTKGHVNLLKQNHIPAILFARGEFMKKYPEAIPYAISQGFLIGNHSYSHPFFSKIPLRECMNEILQTETLIEEAYRLAHQTRPKKVIRLPFGDRGADETRVLAIQNFLKEHNFIPIHFDRKPNHFIDVSWDFDAEDYKTKYIDDLSLYKKHLDHLFNTHKSSSAIVLLHDFDHNRHLFDASMEFFLKKNVSFCL